MITAQVQSIHQVPELSLEAMSATDVVDALAPSKLMAEEELQKELDRALKLAEEFF